MKFRYFLPLLCCLLCAFTGKVIASTCFFESNSASQAEINVPAFWTENTLIGPIGTDNVVQIMNPGPVWATLNPFAGSGVYYTCDKNGGGSYIELTAPTDSTIIEPVYNMNGMGLIKTSVPGIVYSYTLECLNDCATGSNLYVNLPTPGATNKSSVTSSVAFDETTPGKWLLRLDLYQTPDYRPHPGQTQVHAIGGMIGSAMMSRKGKTLHLHVSEGSALFTLMEPTCQNFGINGRLGFNEVDFGDFFVSDFDSQGFTPRRNFTLSLYRCSVNGIQISVSGPHAQDATILTNQKGTAGGVGIRLGTQLNDTWQLVKVDGSVSAGMGFTGNIDWYRDRIDIPFTGELKKIGTIITPGNFDSTATFTINYE
ncbi:fimbrial protein [Enterobacter bugandensis]|uniref:fimbrial protein n=1 Tax=Enterobacter bugandensis TaxID=881260 RepID=UPI0025C8FBD7|nr:fimbrial protein [Enterobacter bugandensis]